MKPLIRTAVHNTYIAPLPSLILLRATVGLYYDIIKGGTPVLNDANARFEEYARTALTTYCPAFEASPAVKYVVKKNPVETPDVLLKQEGRIVAVFECKATKLTFEAQYGDDPVENARSGYEQMAKAVFQLWKFFSHVRRGLVELDVAEDAAAIVLTMDAWTQMSAELRARIITQAEQLAADKEPEIEAEDKRQPIFCSIQDLDELLLTSDEEHLFGAFKVATQDKYIGWGTRRWTSARRSPLTLQPSSLGGGSSKAIRLTQPDNLPRCTPFQVIPKQHNLGREIDESRRNTY